MRIVNQTVFSPDGEYFLQIQEHEILVWRKDRERGQGPCWVFPNGYGTLFSVASWSASSRIIVAGSHLGEVFAWERETGQTLLASRKPYTFASILQVACSPHDQFLAALTPSHVCVWEITTRACVMQFFCGTNAWVEWITDRSLRTSFNEVWSF